MWKGIPDGNLNAEFHLVLFSRLVYPSFVCHLSLSQEKCLELISLQNQGRFLPQTKNEHLEDAIPEQFQMTISENFALQLLFELVKNGPLLQPGVVHCVYGQI